MHASSSQDLPLPIRSHFRPRASISRMNQSEMLSPHSSCRVLRPSSRIFIYSTSSQSRSVLTSCEGSFKTTSALSQRACLSFGLRRGRCQLEIPACICILKLLPASSDIIRCSELKISSRYALRVQGLPFGWISTICSTQNQRNLYTLLRKGTNKMVDSQLHTKGHYHCD